MIFESGYPGWAYLPTDKGGKARIDALLLRGGVIKAVAEQKSRTFTLAEFRGEFNSEWLVTHDKVLAGCAVARYLAVPFYGLLYIVPDDVVLIARIALDDGTLARPVRVRKTKTQATVNGGVAVRDNAFVDMTDAIELRGLAAHGLAPVSMTTDEWLREFDAAG